MLHVLGDAYFATHVGYSRIVLPVCPVFARFILATGFALHCRSVAIAIPSLLSGRRYPMDVSCALSAAVGIADWVYIFLLSGAQAALSSLPAASL